MNYQFLAKTLLFQGITPEEIKDMMGCLEGQKKIFDKGEVIYHVGEIAEKAGLVLSGSVHVENDDVWGNRTLLAYVGTGQMFAENYVCVSGEPMMVRVTVAERAEILFLNLGQSLQTCSHNYGAHGRLIQNLLIISARKSLNLSRRIFYTTSKSIRGRLLSYLSDQATHFGSLEFDIPFNRQQLADYLGVDRSAMSNELSKMQKEGLLTFRKNHFCIKQNALSAFL